VVYSCTVQAVAGLYLKIIKNKIIIMRISLPLLSKSTEVKNRKEYDMKMLAVTVSLGAALLVTMTAPSYAAGGDAILKRVAPVAITPMVQRKKRR